MGHPWIFSGALARVDGGIEDGTIASVADSAGNHLGYGYYNSRSGIAVRMLSLGERKIDKDFLRERITRAAAQRAGDPGLSRCNSYRLFYSESDGLPGFIADRYGEYIVIQSLTLGIERLKNDLVEILIDMFKPAGMYERSDHPGRALEGMEEFTGDLSGATPDEVEVEERGARFIACIKSGQKTGFFLDQRENRSLVKSYSSGRDVLNLFSYTGGFTVAALQGGAASVISVDSSRDSLDCLTRNVKLNSCTGNSEIVEDNVFDFVRSRDINSSFIIIDPPALVKKRGDVNRGSRAYKDVNMNVFRKCPPGSYVLTCSCSRYIDIGLFQKILFSAMLDSGRRGSIVGRQFQSTDHPVSLFHPESEYLKSMLLFVE